MTQLSHTLSEPKTASTLAAEARARRWLNLTGLNVTLQDATIIPPSGRIAFVDGTGVLRGLPAFAANQSIIISHSVADTIQALNRRALFVISPPLRLLASRP